ncbi:MAG: HEAT repeat domain-containing protein [Gemmatimonadetes bacterium]|nr:HEAT repeat domain-containing protein [Gemmatimonadota bacterium]
MTTSQVPAPGAAPGDADDFDGPIPPAAIEEMLRGVSRALRARQMYPGNNPMWLKALETVQGTFAPIWAADDTLLLTISETEIKYGPHVVLHEADQSADSLPWTFFKDGVRGIVLSEGFEKEELAKLVELLPRVKRSGPDDDDLQMLLWESGFSFLKYQHVEVGGDGPAFDDQMGAPTRWSDDPEGRRARAGTPGEYDGTEAGGGGGTADGAGGGEGGEERKSGIVNLADFDSSLYFLDESELNYLRTEVVKEYARDHRSNVLAMLLDTFESQAEPAVRDEICELLDYFVLTLLTQGELRAVAWLLKEAGESAQRAVDLQPAHRDRLLHLPDRMSEPETLSEVLQGLDVSPHLPAQEELNALFDQLRVTALGTIFGWLGRLEQPPLRTLLEGAADRMARGNTLELVKLLSSPERLVQLEAVRRSGALKTAAAVAPMGKVLSDGDAELRQACVVALAEIGSPGAMQLLERAIGDADRDVRVAAARAITASRYRAAYNRLDAIIKGKEIRERDKTEMMAMFEAFGAVTSDPGIALLDSLLNGKGFLGRREDAEIRVCAAAALGRAGGPKAQESLRKAVDEKDVVVRNAVNRALRGEATK